MFKDTKGKRNVVKNTYERFNMYLIKTKDGRQTDITEGVEIEEGMSMRRSLRRGNMTEAPNIVFNG